MLKLLFGTMLGLPAILCSHSAQARYLQSDPIGLGGGVSTYAYAKGNTVRNIDPKGLATAVMVGGPAGYNVMGHVAIAFTDQGVDSYGTSEDFGSSTTAYLASQAAYRSTTVYILNTTPDQEAKMAQWIRDNYGPGTGKYSVFNHDCATMVNGALDLVGIGSAGIADAAAHGILYMPQDPNTAAERASAFPGVQTVPVPQGAPVPSAMNQFNRP